MTCAGSQLWRCCLCKGVTADLMSRTNAGCKLIVTKGHCHQYSGSYMHHDHSAIDPAGGQLQSSLQSADGLQSTTSPVKQVCKALHGYQVRQKQSVVSVHVTRPAQVILMLLVLISIALH